MHACLCRPSTTQRHTRLYTPHPKSPTQPNTTQVADRATYVQRYGVAAAAATSGAAIGELCAHARLLPLGAGAGVYGAHHVLPLLEAMADASYVYMVFPYADGPDAFDRVAATGGGLPEEEAQRYFADIALGVLHLKRHGISHGYERSCVYVWVCRRRGIARV